MSELVSVGVATQPKISGNGKRLWSKEQRQFVVAEAAKPGMSVSQVSRRYNINANQIFIESDYRRWLHASLLEASFPLA